MLTKRITSQFSNPVHAKMDWHSRRNEKVFQASVQEWFAYNTSQIQTALRTKFQKDIVSELTDWEYLNIKGQEILKPATLSIMQTGGREAYKLLGVQSSFDVLNPESVKAAGKFTAKLVREVNGETKKGIRAYIKAGVQDGKSMDKISRELRPLVGLTERQTQSVLNYKTLLKDKDKYPELSASDITKKTNRYAEKTHRRRMQAISRTETARAQTMGYITGMDDLGVLELQFSAILDDVTAPACVDLNGNKFRVSDAADIIPVHPNCRCAMLPVMAGKIVESSAQALDMMPEHIDDLVVRWENAVSRSNKWVLKDKLRKLGFDTSGNPLGVTPPPITPPVIVPPPVVTQIPQEITDLITRWKNAQSRSSKWVHGNKLKQLGYDVKTGVYKPTGVPVKPVPKPTPKPEPKPPRMANTDETWMKSLSKTEKNAIDDWARKDGYDMRPIDEMGAKKFFDMIKPGIEAGDLKAARKEIAVFEKKVKTMNKALDRSPIYEGEIYRGFNQLSTIDALKLSKVGSIQEVKGMTSFSSSRAVSEKWAKFFRGGPISDNNSVVWVTRSRKAVGIQNLAIKNQAEVIVRRTKFKVVDVKVTTLPEAEMRRRVYTVTLEEIPKVKPIPKPKPKIPKPKPEVGTKFETAADYRKALRKLESSRKESELGKRLTKLSKEQTQNSKKIIDSFADARKFKDAGDDASFSRVIEARKSLRTEYDLRSSQIYDLGKTQKVSIKDMRAVLNEEDNLSGLVKGVVEKWDSVADDILSWVPKSKLDKFETSSLRSLRVLQEKKYGTTVGEYEKVTQTLTMFVKTDSVFAHEFGHHISYSVKSIMQKQSAFFNKRTAGEVTKKLKGFGKDTRGRDIVGKKDKFGKVDVYAGRVYEDGRAPEVISVGLEHLWKNPMSFAKKDPEWFDMIVSALKKIPTKAGEL